MLRNLSKSLCILMSRSWLLLIDTNIQLKKIRGDYVTNLSMHRLLGVTHLMKFFRFVIAYSICRLSRYMHNPNKYHWIELVRLIKYLRGTMNYGIIYSGFYIVLEWYNNANWILNSDKTNSISGYIFTLDGGITTWKSGK